MRAQWRTRGHRQRCSGLRRQHAFGVERPRSDDEHQRWQQLRWRPDDLGWQQQHDVIAGAHASMWWANQRSLRAHASVRTIAEGALRVRAVIGRKKVRAVREKLPRSWTRSRCAPTGVAVPTGARHRASTARTPPHAPSVIVERRDSRGRSVMGEAPRTQRCGNFPLGACSHTRRSASRENSPKTYAGGRS